MTKEIYEKRRRIGGRADGCFSRKRVSTAKKIPALFESVDSKNCGLIAPKIERHRK